MSGASVARSPVTDIGGGAPEDVVEGGMWKNLSRKLGRKTGRTLIVLVFAGYALSVSNASGGHTPSEIIGTWRGSSTCTDLVAAPGCRDEVVVYEFTAVPKSGTVRWNADKVIDGKRQPMGEMDLAYDTDAKCWKAEFTSPRLHSVWCLVVDGDHLTGTGRLLPGKETIRKIDARRN